MTKERMLLPVACEKHVHVGHGPSKETPCPWCEIERLKHDVERLTASLTAEVNAHEPAPALPAGFTQYVDAVLDADPSNYRRAAEPRAPIDAGLRYKPTLERASNTREGWVAEMEQAHDGEWVHISALNRRAE
jgi:hypothetical protein